MTAELEFTGRNIQKAVQLAAKTFGIRDKDVKYEIISHGSTGIFGLASIKKARIKVRRDPKTQILADEGPLTTDHDVALKESGKSPEAMIALEEGQKLGEAVLRRIVDALSPESTIKIEKNAQALRFHIEGGQSGILIGKRGQTLEAIQLIVDKAVHRLNGNKVRPQVDVEGYLAKKKMGLVRTAERLAQKVAAKGSPTSIGYLNAQDRRIVHIALKKDPKIRTQSVGEGPIRKLMIYPRRKPGTKF
jgi:spoIIIJ-associated protein